MADARPELSDAMDALGQPGFVTVPGGVEVETTVIWVPPDHRLVPDGSDAQAMDALKVLAIPRAAADAVPRGTLIRCGEFEGAPDKVWRADGPHAEEWDHTRAVVVLDAEATAALETT